MAQKIFVITGTDTGVGKTVFTALLTRHARKRGCHVAALKPLCSGGRDDARSLHHACGRTLSLDSINPWHFRAPLSPLLAARRERRRVDLESVLRHIRTVAAVHELTLIEGAGGLLSPLGEDFDTGTWIRALSATPLVVAANRLGVLNQVLLILKALPPASARRARILLVAPPRPSPAARSNTAFLRELLGTDRVLEIPWMPQAVREGRKEPGARVQKTLDRLLGWTRQAG